MNAVALDHVVPWSYNHAARQERKTVNRTECVPACKECNCLLSNFFFITVADRAAFIARRLAERNAKVLRAPDWTEAEYKQLSGNLLKQVKSMQTKKKVVMARIAYAQLIADMPDLTIEQVWESQSAELKREARTEAITVAPVPTSVASQPSPNLAN
jgi:ribosomal protein L22